LQSIRSFGLRVKVPLLIVAISVATAAAISIAIAISARHWLREDLRDHIAAVGQSLGRGLVAHITRDDVWEAFEAVRSVATVEGPERCDIIVLDTKHHIFVASDPSAFTTGASTSALPERFVRAAALEPRQGNMAAADVIDGEQMYSVLRMPLSSSDGEVVGELLMAYSHAVFSQRYLSTVTTVVAISSGLALLLLPIGLWLGHRISQPMSQATEKIYALAGQTTTSAAKSLVGQNGPLRQSELDRLQHSVAFLEQQLGEKRQLEKQVVAADRLAAIGRMTSGIAHEINNPLAGMLNALSNLRKDPCLLPKTVAMLERGLDQIRHTLSALLIETRTTTRHLSPGDVDDLQVLIVPQAKRKHLQLRWNYEPQEELEVPAGPVRQVLLNLLLNAVNAADRYLEFHAKLTPAGLRMRVQNDGRQFPADRVAAPFEPVIGGEGNGLGLWASHQLVTSLGGRIELSVEDGRTTFDVLIPLLKHPRLRVGERIEVNA
jgi:signal transduction histidine kinase